MDNPYPEYPQHNYQRPNKYHSITSSTPISSAYSPAATVTRPAPAALRGLQESRAKGPREQTNARRSKHSIPHNGATCGNTLCDDPHIAADDRLCPGPEGLQLCSRCYKRYKIERRRAKEAQRPVTDKWRKPKRIRSKEAVDEDGGDPGSKSYDEKTKGQDYKRYRREPSKDARPHNTPPPNLERGEISPDLNDRSSVSTFNEKEYGRRSSRSPQKHASFAEEKEYINKSSRSPQKHASFADDMEHGRRRSRSPRKHASFVDEKDYSRRSSQSPRKSRSRREKEVHYSRSEDSYDDEDSYKYRRAEEGGNYSRGRRCCCSSWSPRRKCLVILAAVISAIVLIIIIALAATLTRKKDDFNYTPFHNQVNSTVAFQTGGGTRKNVNDTDDGIGAGTDSYTYYKGNESNFPAASKWVSFDKMWDANLETFEQSCGWLDRGENNSPEIIKYIYDAIQDRANASLVDHRIILATIIQETNGCPLNPPTTSSGGTRNPGLMQSHNGHEYNEKHPRLSILQMIQDGTQGTDHGWGLVDNLNTYGHPYKALRGYNSGYIPNSGDLSEKAGATACYVSDIANRLTGWVRAKHDCEEE